MATCVASDKFCSAKLTFPLPSWQINGYRAESSDSLVVSRMQFSFFQGKKDRTLLALEIETLNGTRAGDELAWSREAINRIFLIYDLSLLGAGARFEIDTCTCSERKGP